MSQSVRRDLLVAQGWIQAVVIVVLCGFLILGILAYRTYTDEPPIPSRVVDSTGQVLFTGTDVIAGQEVFLRNGLMGLKGNGSRWRSCASTTSCRLWC